MNRPMLQIIRGMPGSGKTTLAVKRYPHLLHFESDMYFTRAGRYKFTKKRNAEAVDWFLTNVSNVANFDKIDFVITGVFAAHTERLQHCIDQALLNGYEVYIKTLKNDFGNIHNVPKAHLDAMRAAFVSDRELKEKYKGCKRIHFGLMSKELKV